MDGEGVGMERERGWRGGRVERVEDGGWRMEDSGMDSINVVLLLSFAQFAHVSCCLLVVLVVCWLLGWLCVLLYNGFDHPTG